MDRKGFTLIELMIVTTIVGILAAIAIPRFGTMSERAHISAMQSDLGNMLRAQELYYQANDFVYADDVADLASYFEATNGVTIVINAANGLTWDASATHASTPVSCAYDAAVGEIDCS